MNIEIEVYKARTFVLIRKNNFVSNHLNLGKAFYFVESALDRRKTPEQVFDCPYVSFAIKHKANNILYSAQKKFVTVSWVNIFDQKMITTFTRNDGKILFSLPITQ